MKKMCGRCGRASADFRKALCGGLFRTAKCSCCVSELYLLRAKRLVPKALEPLHFYPLYLKSRFLRRTPGGRHHLLGGGQHRVCLVCGNAAALPSACLRGAAPHPSSAQSTHRSEHPAGKGIPNYASLRLLSKRNPLRWAFVWFQKTIILEETT